MTNGEWKDGIGKIGWIKLGDYGEVNPRQWGSGIDKHVATFNLPNGEGHYLHKGDELLSFEFSEVYVVHANGFPSLEVVFENIGNGAYSVKYREYIEEPDNKSWTGE